jgi:excisionase family DNA binding protein
MPTLFPGNDVVTPTATDTEVAKASSRLLAPYIGDASLHIQVNDGRGNCEVILPPAVARLLLGILTELGQGNAVAMSPIQAELTMNQAADLLNISQVSLQKLLDDGTIPFRTVSTQLRIRLADVLAHKQETYTLRRAALAELTALSQELGLYDVPKK